MEYRRSKSLFGFLIIIIRVYYRREKKESSRMKRIEKFPNISQFHSLSSSTNTIREQSIPKGVHYKQNSVYNSRESRHCYIAWLYSWWWKIRQKFLTNRHWSLLLLVYKFNSFRWLKFETPLLNNFCRRISFGRILEMI